MRAPTPLPLQIFTEPTKPGFGKLISSKGNTGKNTARLIGRVDGVNRVMTLPAALRGAAAINSAWSPQTRGADRGRRPRETAPVRPQARCQITARSAHRKTAGPVPSRARNTMLWAGWWFVDGCWSALRTAVWQPVPVGPRWKPTRAGPPAASPRAGGVFFSRSLASASPRKQRWCLPGCICPTKLHRHHSAPPRSRT